MTLRIVPDPASPLGGWALLIVANETAATETRLRIQRLEDDMVLNAEGWSPGGDLLGPFPIEQTSDGAALRLGPGIVNAMEPFQKLHLDLPDIDISSDTFWPEDIRKLISTRRRRAVRAPAGGSDEASGGPAITAPQTGVKEAKLDGAKENDSSALRPSAKTKSPAESEKADQNPFETDRTRSGGTEDEGGSTKARSGHADSKSTEQGEGGNEGAPIDTLELESKRGGSSKGLVIGVGTALLLLVGVAAYFLLPQQAEQTQDTPPDIAPACDPGSVSNDNDDARWSMAKACIDEGELRQALQLV